MRSGSLCALLWRLLSWCSLREVCLRARHIPGRLNVIADKLSRHRQVIQTQWSLHPDLSQVAPSQTGPVCDKVQLQATPVCVPSPRPQGVGCGCLKPILGQSGSVCLSSGSSVDKYPDQSSQSSLQEDDNSSSGVAQHALVLGPGGNVLPNTDVPSKSPRSPDSAIQRQSSHGSTKPEPSC